MTHSSSLSSREREVLCDDVTAEDSRLGGQRCLTEGTGRFPGRRPRRAYQAVSNGGARPGHNRSKACGGGKLPHTALGVPRFMREIRISDVATKRTHGVRHPGDEDTTRQQSDGDLVEDVEDFFLGQVLQHIRGRDGGKFPRVAAEMFPEVALMDPV